MTAPAIGEIFKSSLAGKVYEVERILDQMVVLHSSNGLSQVLTEKENLNLFYKKISAIEAANKDFVRRYGK